ncbi:hypothetical protein BC629DRAFT_1724143 [Irpex lacteus]|nr:hypothetical protein BC629DRAFT_1724143 [Irpex lacteus]
MYIRVEARKHTTFDIELVLVDAELEQVTSTSTPDEPVLKNGKTAQALPGGMGAPTESKKCNLHPLCTAQTRPPSNFLRSTKDSVTRRAPGQREAAGAADHGSKKSPIVTCREGGFEGQDTRFRKSELGNRNQTLRLRRCFSFATDLSQNGKKPPRCLKSLGTRLMHRLAKSRALHGVRCEELKKAQEEIIPVVWDYEHISKLEGFSNFDVTVTARPSLLASAPSALRPAVTGAPLFDHEAEYFDFALQKRTSMQLHVDPPREAGRKNTAGRKVPVA